MLADAYRSGHRRVVALVAGLADEGPARTVPACPDWAVRDLVAHLVGTAADVAGRRPAGMASPEWTAGHVDARRDRGIDDLLDEWVGLVDTVAEAVEDRRVPMTVVQDLLVHEGDLVETLGAACPPWEGWAGPARMLVRQVVRGVRGPEALVVRSGGSEWRSPDDPGARRALEEGRARSVLTVDFYELYRGLSSRRSRAQMRAWEWDGDADPWVSSLPVYGPRDDEQPIPRPAPPR